VGKTKKKNTTPGPCPFCGIDHFESYPKMEKWHCGTVQFLNDEYDLSLLCQKLTLSKLIQGLAKESQCSGGDDRSVVLVVPRELWNQVQRIVEGDWSCYVRTQIDQVQAKYRQQTQDTEPKGQDTKETGTTGLEEKVLPHCSGDGGSAGASGGSSPLP